MLLARQTQSTCKGLSLPSTLRSFGVLQASSRAVSVCVAGPACNAAVLRRCSAAVSQCRPVRPSRKLACSAKAMVNVDFASPSLVLGAVLIGCGVLLLQMRNLQTKVSRDADIVVAAMISIVGSTLIFQGWRLDPLLLLCQALTTSVAVWYGIETFRLRSKEEDEMNQNGLPTQSTAQSMNSSSTTGAGGPMQPDITQASMQYPQYVSTPPAQQEQGQMPRQGPAYQPAVMGPAGSQLQYPSMQNGQPVMMAAGQPALPQGQTRDFFSQFDGAGSAWAGQALPQPQLQPLPLQPQTQPGQPANNSSYLTLQPQYSLPDSGLQPRYLVGGQAAQAYPWGMEQAAPPWQPVPEQLPGPGFSAPLPVSQYSQAGEYAPHQEPTWGMHANADTGQFPYMAMTADSDLATSQHPAVSRQGQQSSHNSTNGSDRSNASSSYGMGRDGLVLDGGQAGQGLWQQQQPAGAAPTWPEFREEPEVALHGARSQGQPGVPLAAQSLADARGGVGPGPGSERQQSQQQGSQQQRGYQGASPQLLAPALAAGVGDSMEVVVEPVWGPRSSPGAPAPPQQGVAARVPGLMAQRILEHIDDWE
ncbi:hypothetical protein QJQ45_016454 [Haematococcus lacustris]|nr:hypothetical protein QJQ45_016454 [Haematococcus lacustris]